MCKYCPRSYKHKKGLYQHLRQQHPKEWEALQREMQANDEAKPFKCTICCKRFPSWGTLYTHRSRHHRLEKVPCSSIIQKEWPCPRCDMVFTFYDDFVDHVRVECTATQGKIAEGNKSDATSRTSFDGEPSPGRKSPQKLANEAA